MYAILYQIGNGVSPKVDPGCLSTEGLDFLSHCFEVEPSKRWTAGQLRDHPFVKVNLNYLWTCMRDTIIMF